MTDTKQQWVPGWLPSEWLTTRQAQSVLANRDWNKFLVAKREAAVAVAS